jgi:hypothetical protein
MGVFSVIVFANCLLPTASCQLLFANCQIIMFLKI